MSVRARECTGHGPGGVRLVAVTGRGALERVRALAPSNGERLKPGALVVVRLEGRGAGAERAIDEVLVRVQSEESVELGLHGGPAVVRRLLEELGGGGAQGGEQLSLEDDARALLPSAASEVGARILLDQAEGALRRELLALVRSSEQEFDAHRTRLEQRSRWLSCAVTPRRVVLAGPANAGKSTLFNLLAGHERVVVDPTPGTTRDAIAERVQFGAWPVELFDTAGERPAEAGSVERAGQELALQIRRQADLCFWLSQNEAQPALGEGPNATRLVRLMSRSGAAEPAAGPERPARVASLEDPHGTSDVVAESFRAALDLPADPWTPGAGVPFRPAHLAWLAELGASVPAERPNRLAKRLEQGSCVASEPPLG